MLLVLFLPVFLLQLLLVLLAEGAKARLLCVLQVWLVVLRLLSCACSRRAGLC